MKNEEKPIYKNTDPEAIFLGNYKGEDLYFTPKTDSRPFPLVASRFGDGSEEYSSFGIGTNFHPDQFDLRSNIFEPLRRAIEGGLIPNVPLEKAKEMLDLREAWLNMSEEERKRLEKISRENHLHLHTLIRESSNKDGEQKREDIVGESFGLKS